MTELSLTGSALIAEVRQLISEARLRAASAVYAELTNLYWQVGNRIHREILGSQRAGNGEEILSTVSRQLTADSGRGSSAQNLRHMVKFAETFSDEAIVSTVWRQLSWSQLKMLIYLEDPLKRDFYLELSRLERWSVRQLRERMQSMLYERSATLREIEQFLLELRAASPSWSDRNGCRSMTTTSTSTCCSTTGS